MILTKYKKFTALFALLSLVYCLQTVLPAPDKATLVKYHIDASQLLILDFTIIIPYVIIWFIALIGYLRLRSYVDSIKGTKDGDAFRVISNGVLWLALWMPLSAISGAFTSHIYRVHPYLTADMVRLDNYVNIALLFPALVLIFLGTQQLTGLLKNTVRAPQTLLLSFICLEAVYLFLVFHDPARMHPVNGLKVASYYEPDWLIGLSLVIPRLVMWFLGIQAVYNVYIYQKKIKGSVYKKALKNLAIGLGGVVITSILLRSIQSVSSVLNKLSLAALLVVVYLLLAIMSAAYLYIANGSKNLQKIEDL